MYLLYGHMTVKKQWIEIITYICLYICNFNYNYQSNPGPFNCLYNRLDEKTKQEEYWNINSNEL